MNWIWDHLQLILVAAGAIAVWLNQRRREKSGEPADYDEDGVPDNRIPSPPAMREFTPVSRDGSDPAQEERVRRIQEEIRRKIAERRGQAVPPPMPAPTMEPFNPLRPVFREEPPASVPARRAAPPVPPAREVAVGYDDTAALERQRRIAEQLEELETRRRDARRTAQALAETGAIPVSARERTRAHAETAVTGARSLGTELRDPKALRRAIVLREVLDAPVALR